MSADILSEERIKEIRARCEAYKVYQEDDTDVDADKAFVFADECTVDLPDALDTIEALRARVVELEGALRAMIGWSVEPAEPPAPGHVCGPEGNCDCICMAWGHYEADLVKAKAALSPTEGDARPEKNYRPMAVEGGDFDSPQCHTCKHEICESEDAKGHRCRRDQEPLDHSTGVCDWHEAIEWPAPAEDDAEEGKRDGCGD